MKRLISQLDGRPSVFICYAAEALNLSRGGSLRKMSSRLFGYYEVMFDENEIGVPPGRYRVFESRYLTIGRLGSGLEPVASGNGIEAFISDSGYLGLMFHPEKSYEFGIKILRTYFYGKYF